MGQKRNSTRDPVNVLWSWVRKQSIKVNIFLGLTTLVTILVLLKFLVREHDHFFVASEAVHFLGIMLLIYKLTNQKTCSGLSLKAQELTAIFLAARLFCSLTMENDIHTVLDFATLLATLYVIYMIRFKLQSTYINELDNLQLLFLIPPCALLAIVVHPNSRHTIIQRISWAFCVYLESISVLPQLRLMQNAKMVEPLTSHYVFALGVARFLGAAHWIIRVVETRGKYLFLLGSGLLWPPMVFLAEIIQTFILADFCYYYIKSVLDGQLLTRLPSMV